MKKAIICFKCRNLKKESESYQVKVTQYFVEVSQNGEGKKLLDNLVMKVKICRLCARRAGYKVKKTKKVVRYVQPAND